MAWIEVSDVAAVHPSIVDDDHDRLLAVIDHVQGLAETVIGTQTTPTFRLKAVLVQLVYRFHLASSTDENIQQETIGSYSYSRAQIAGLGLTNAEKKLLRAAVGLNSLRVIGTTRGELETAGPEFGGLIPWSEVEEA